MKLLVKKDNITKIIAIMVDFIFSFFRIFLLTIGLLCVSAGLFLNINSVNIIPKINFTKFGIVTILEMYDNPRKHITDEIKHI